ncbi:MAG TPA: DUF4038 domain-containing protein [Clostridiales bacterium]|nr:DUF4038 domain-containing protein [Clostridiales bacterium]
MRQFEMKEWTFTGPEPETSKVYVDLKAVFTHEEETIELDGFYAGNGQYKVRFFPRKLGKYSWKVRGVIDANGEEECSPSDKCGIVKADGLHFKYESGSKFIPFGTTVYALIHQDKKLVDTTMKTLSSSPFNKVRFCVFPKHFDYNHNEPKYFAYEKTDGQWDVDRPCYFFWDEMEDRLTQMEQMGIQADLILFHPYDHWGFSKLSKDQCLTYLNYATRRLAAFPNLWWSLANEFDTIPNFEYGWWAEFASYISKRDPYGHLLSNHNCLVYWDFDNADTTHCSIQDSNVQNIPDYQKKYGKPVVFDECCYEGNVPHSWGNISAFEMVNRFWIATVCGGYCTHGETYITQDEILWWSRGGIMHGESPSRIAFLKSVIEKLPTPIDFLPDPEANIGGLEQLKTNPADFSKLPGFTKNLIMNPYERIISFIEGSRKYQGHCGNHAFIYYYARQCTSSVNIMLPEGKFYKIELLDVWNMTRTEVFSNVTGKVGIPLPGKEGMALLATLICEE